MISFNSLGAYGRLGNQMFQYAALRGIAAKHGYEYVLPPSNAQNEWTDHLLFKAFELASLKHNQVQFHNTGTVIRERCFEFDRDTFDTCPDGVDLFGYFQSEKYFDHITNDIKNDLKFKPEIVDQVMQRRQLFNGDLVCLHVRRTDMVEKTCHGTCTFDYYSSALSHIDSDLPVMIFTDDPNWVREQPFFNNKRFYMSLGHDNLYDMCFMTTCNYHIIANSTFSWWGAWLSNSKRVFAPHVWFNGPPLNEYNTSDLIPDRWLRL